MRGGTLRKAVATALVAEAVVVAVALVLVRQNEFLEGWTLGVVTAAVVAGVTILVAVAGAVIDGLASEREGAEGSQP